MIKNIISWFSKKKTKKLQKLVVEMNEEELKAEEERCKRVLPKIGGIREKQILAVRQAAKLARWYHNRLLAIEQRRRHLWRQRRNKIEQNRK